MPIRVPDLVQMFSKIAEEHGFALSRNGAGELVLGERVLVEELEQYTEGSSDETMCNARLETLFRECLICMVDRSANPITVLHR